jgi:HAD superfamily hydrolase (TIGR01450 family)
VPWRYTGICDDDRPAASGMATDHSGGNMAIKQPAKVILFDLDGTIYLSGVLYPGVTELVDRLNRSNIQFGFLTNNSTIGPGSYLRKLKALDLDIRQHNVLTSAEATCLMLEDLNIGPELYILGTQRFRRFLKGRGYVHTVAGAQAVLVGFDTELTYRKLTEATRLLLNGVPLLASHPDPVCPGPYPDAGMLLEYFKAASPDIHVTAIAGKPHKWIVKLVEERFGVGMDQVIMVGDRLNTDIRFARTYGMRSILVLNGEPRPAMDGDDIPDVVADHIAEVADRYWPEQLGWT